MAGGWRGEGGQHQGARSYQEDSWALRSLPDGSLLAVVADGMGGHAGGAVASKIVVSVFLKTAEGGGSLRDALLAANAAVKTGAENKPELAGMGSTLLAVRLKGDDVSWVSVGDSPFFILLTGRIERLNADHSLAPQIDALVARGEISAADAAAHPGRHTLRDAVMGEPLKLIDEGYRRLGQDATLLLCSDGVESIPHERLATSARLSVGGMIDAIIAARRPRQDNVTIIKLERKG